MNILFDHQAFTMQRFGGVSRYFISLMQNLPALCDYSLLIKYSENFYLKSFFNKNFYSLFTGTDFIGKKVILDLLNQQYVKNEFRKLSYDIYHPTYYNPFLIKKNKKPVVVTVHDMIHEIYPGMVSVFDRAALYKKKIVQKADIIIAVSENTKKDLISIYGTNQKKIVTIYHGYSPVINQIHDASLSLPEKYILFAGSRYEYKNFNTFIEAFSIIAKNYPEFRLVIAGSGTLSVKETALLANLNLKNKYVHYTVLTDEQFSTLYNKAWLFVYPSRYEGFGFPILEAFANQCPVALSNTSSFPEVAGDAAVYFNPDDCYEIAGSIESIILNDKLRKDLIAKGTEKLKSYSWQSTAQKTYEVYKSLIK